MNQSMPLTIAGCHEPEAAAPYERGLVLVRPDGHVAWRGNALPMDAGALLDRVRGTI